MKLNSPGFRLAALATTTVLLFATPSAIAAVKSFKAHSLVHAKIKIVKSSSSLRVVTATTVAHIDATPSPASTPTPTPTPTQTLAPTPTITPSPMPSISSTTDANQEAGDDNESDDNVADDNSSDDNELALSLTIDVGDHEQD